MIIVVPHCTRVKYGRFDRVASTRVSRDTVEDGDCGGRIYNPNPSPPRSPTQSEQPRMQRSIYFLTLLEATCRLLLVWHSGERQSSSNSMWECKHRVSSSNVHHGCRRFSDFLCPRRAGPSVISCTHCKFRCRSFLYTWRPFPRGTEDWLMEFEMPFLDNDASCPEARRAASSVWQTIGGRCLSKESLPQQPTP